ncbi:MAG: 3-isopropylmalate dehydratase [Halobacteriales archaeon SW_9_67_25]|nr:MAG: 3-isopropylmalate dehydratase [Halobacteriales archaeon SW_9_67_25]
MALESPVLVEGLPGVGLVGKIAADHLVREFDMTHVASCHCEGIPNVVIYAEDERDVRPPVRFYADEARDLLALQSDVPISPNAAVDFASCVTGWLGENDATPLYLSGLPEEKEGIPELYGVHTGDAEGLLADHDIPAPSENGMISGPTGALLAEASEQDLDSLGLVVQANANFPDPEAARVLLTRAIGPIAGVDVETDTLVEQADRIAQAREQLAQQMQQAEEESTRAEPLGMYQ